MAQKINPKALRIGITKPWHSRWFFKRSRKYFIEEDYTIREIIKKRIIQAGIADIKIERTSQEIRVTIKASRPGLIIGRGGKGIEDLKKEIVRDIVKRRKRNNQQKDFNLNLNVEELKRTEISAPVVAQQVATDIERRLPFRRVLKRHLELLKQNRGVKGVKIRIAGRLGGSEIARSEWLAHGRMPLQTLRADIDYGEARAYNTYGTIGVKVWLYKGEIFDE